MSLLNDSIMMSSGEGGENITNCTNSDESNDCSPEANTFSSLWMIFALSIGILLLIFTVLLLVCIALKRLKVFQRKTQWKNSSHDDNREEWRGIVTELNTHVHDRNAIMSSNNHTQLETSFNSQDNLNSSQRRFTDTNGEAVIERELVQQDGSVFKLMSTLDDTYDRLTPSVNGSQSDAGTQPDMMSSTAELLNNDRSPSYRERRQEESDYDDILTSSMGPARRMDTLNSTGTNSVYYVYIPERDSEAVYSLPNTQQRNSSNYLNVLGMNGEPFNLSQCPPGDDEYTLPDGLHECLYSNVQDSPQQATNTNQVYSLPDELLYSKGLIKEDTYCSIEGGDDTCRVSGIYALPGEPNVTGTSIRMSSIYTSIDDIGDQSYSYAAPHSLVSPKSSEEGEIIAAGEATTVQQSEEGYSYASPHKLVSPQSSLLGDVQEAPMNVIAATHNPLYAASDGTGNNPLYAVSDGTGNNPLYATGSNTDNPLYAGSNTDNPLYAPTRGGASSGIMRRQKSSTLPPLHLATLKEGHSYQNIKKIILPPRRNTQFPSSSSGHHSSNGVDTNSVGSKRGEELRGENNEDKDYVGEWLREVPSPTASSGGSHTYMPVMTSGMYNHKYMKPHMFLNGGQSLSQPTTTTNGDSNIRTNRSATVSSPVKEETEYQNWPMIALAQRSKSDTFDHSHH